MRYWPKVFSTPLVFTVAHNPNPWECLRIFCTNKVDMLVYKRDRTDCKNTQSFCNNTHSSQTTDAVTLDELSPVFVYLATRYLQKLCQFQCHFMEGSTVVHGSGGHIQFPIRHIRIRDIFGRLTSDIQGYIMPLHEV